MIVDTMDKWEFKPIYDLGENKIYSQKDSDKLHRIIMTSIQLNPLTVNIQRTLKEVLQRSLPKIRILPFLIYYCLYHYIYVTLLCTDSFIGLHLATLARCLIFNFVYGTR